MKKIGLFLLGIIFALTIAKAQYEHYSISFRVFPEEANNNVLIAGYISLGDYSSVADSNQFYIKVYKDGVLYRTYGIDKINYYNDIDMPSYLTDGFFYVKDTFPAGDYSAIIFIEDEPKTEAKSFIVSGNTSPLTFNVIGVSQTDDTLQPIVVAKSDKDDFIDIYVYGKLNFDNPIRYNNIALYKDTSTTLNLDPISVSDLTSNNNVYGLIIMGKTSEGYTEPYVFVRRTGTRDVGLENLQFSIINDSLKKGVENKITYQISSNALLPLEFSFNFEGDLGQYASAQNITLLPGQTKEGEIIINLPRKYNGSSDLIIHLLTENIEKVYNYSFNLIEADKIHEVNILNVTFDKDFYYKGDVVNAQIILENTGDYDENLWFEVNDGKLLKKWISIQEGEIKSYNITFPAEDEINISLHNSCINKSATYILNTQERVRDFEAYLTKHEILSNKSSNVYLQLFVENTGNTEDIFVISSNYSYIKYSDQGFLLKPGESKYVNITLFIPENKTKVVVNFTISSQIGNKEINDLLIVNTYHKVVLSSSIPKVSIIKDNDVYVFTIENNDTIARTYSLIAPAEVWPTKLTLMPGETGNIYVKSSTPVDYQLAVDNEIVVSDKLSESGITGYAVFIGSAFGVAGLVVLILFIYFYFVRKNSEDDEFKPIEVKKANLEKRPQAKNGKYW